MMLPSRQISLPAFAVLLILASPALADVEFHCGATNKSEECAFSIQHPGGGVTNFVVAAGASHYVNDKFIGDKYCVKVGPKGTPKCSWPECWSQSGNRIVQKGKQNS